MREPKAKLHRPVEALRRLQLLSGMVRGAALNDRYEHRAAKVASICQEMFDVCVAALDGGPLPEPRDHEKAV